MRKTERRFQTKKTVNSKIRADKVQEAMGINKSAQLSPLVVAMPYKRGQRAPRKKWTLRTNSQLL